MATVSATSMIESALQQLGVLGSGASATTQQKNDGLVWLQGMVDNANSDPTMAISSSRTTAVLSSGVNSYTIGSGQTISVARPSKILAASVLQVSGLRMPTRVIQDGLQWTAIIDRDSSSYLIRALWYDRGNTTGTIYLAPKPLGGTLEIIYPTLITNFSDLTTGVEIPPGYTEWMRFGLAVALAGSYDMPVPEPVQAELQKALSNIRTLNAELMGQTPAVAPIPVEISA